MLRRNGPVIKSVESVLKMSQRARYLGQRSLSSKVVVRTHTHRTDCYAWTTVVIGARAVVKSGTKRAERRCAAPVLAFDHPNWRSDTSKVRC